MKPTTCAIVLAAGHGRRMGQDKALLELAGVIAARRVADHCVAAGLGVLIVRRTGAPALPGCESLPTVLVDRPREMIDSLRAGVQGVPAGAPGALVFPVDYAMVGADSIRRVRAALEEGPDGIVLPLHGGRPGHPIGLAARVFPEVLDPATATLRDVIRRDRGRVRAVEVGDPWVLRDLDRPEDLAAARAALSGGAPPSRG